MTTVKRRVISEAESTANNHDRIMRMIAQCSRAVRPAEVRKLRDAIKRTYKHMPDVDTRANLFCSMFPETLSRANLSELDANGFVLNKIEGVAVNAWWLWISLYPLDDLENHKITQPPAYCGVDSGGDELPGRADTMLLVFRDGAMRAVDHCPLLQAAMRRIDGRCGFDAELCVRRWALSEDELARLYEATRRDAPFCAQYLDPDDGNVEDDNERYHLCLAVHDAMLTDTAKQTVSKYERPQPAIAVAPYKERLTKIAERIRPRPAQDYKEFSERIAFEEKEDRCGPWRAPVLVFAKPEFRMYLLRFAFYSLPACIRGIRTDGLIFVGNAQPFSPVFIDADGTVINPSTQRSALKKYKPRMANSFDAMIVHNAETARYELFTGDRDAPVPSAGLWYGNSEEEVARTLELGAEVVAINTAALDARLFVPHERAGAMARAMIAECNPYLSPAAEQAIACVPPPAQGNAADLERYVCAVAAHIRWQPVLERVKKRRANTWANFCGIVTAIGLYPLPEEITTHVNAVLRAKEEASAAEIELAERAHLLAQEQHSMQLDSFGDGQQQQQ
jgi:hypothetical protein